MENISTKTQAGLMLVFVLIALAIAYFLYFKQWYVQIERTQKDIEKVEAEINKGKAISMRIDDFKRQIKDLNERLEKLKSILPTTSEAGKFYSNLNKMANETQVEIMKIKAAQKQTNDVYIELPYELDLSAKFHDIGYFYAQLANYPKIINVKDMTMIVHKNKASIGKYSVDVSCIASTFIYNEATDPKEVGGDL